MLRVSKKTRSNIAQIIICVIVFPYIDSILKILFPDRSLIDLFLELIKSIPIMEIWFELLVDFKGFEELIYELGILEEKYGYVVIYSLYQVYAIAVLIGIVNSIADKLGWKGLRIIPTILAVLLASFLEKFTGTDLVGLLLEDISLLVIYIVILFFASKRAFIKTLFKFIVDLFLSFYIAIFSTMYIAILGLIWIGRIKGTVDIFMSIGVTFSALLVSCLLSYLVSSKKK